MNLRKILLLIPLLTLTFGLAAQIENPANTSCSASERLCMGEYNKKFDFDKLYMCGVMGPLKLYFYFKAGSDAGIPLGTLTTIGTNCNYKLYGPFESHPQGCAQLNEITPAPVASSSSASMSHTINFTQEAGKIYILEVILTGCKGEINITSTRLANCNEEISCTDCIKGFQPGPGNYVVSAWVKEEDALVTKTSYTYPSVVVSCPSVSGSSATFTPSGQIIDGWQRIEGIFTVPALATDFKLELQSSFGYVLFDDIRIFPFDGSMMSYVYDPLTLRLAAELDERNYAKLYEYDEEGKLVRIKKETEKGIMTIQENRESSAKQ